MLYSVLSIVQTKLEEVLPKKTPVPHRAVAVASFCRFLRNQLNTLDASTSTKDPFSLWGMGDASRPNGEMRFPMVFEDKNITEEENSQGSEKLPKGGARGNCHVTIFPKDRRSGDTSYLGQGVNGEHYTVRVAGLKRSAEYGDDSDAEVSEFELYGKIGENQNRFNVFVDGQTVNATLIETENDVALYTNGISLSDVPEDADPVVFRSEDSCKYFLSLPTVDFESETMSSSAPQVQTPMPGRVVKVMVNEGDDVEEGQAVMILEAMKMEHVIKSPIKGKVANIRFSESQQVGDGEVLAVFEAAAVAEEK